MENRLKEKQKQEGIVRITEIQKQFQLNPNLIKYLKEGKVYFSYRTGGGTIGSVDTIDSNKEYMEMIRRFENERQAYVYHAVESNLRVNNEEYHFLSLLYVSKYKSDWEMERIHDNYIPAYVINLQDKHLSEIGDIFLNGFKGALDDYNVLVRVG